MLYLIGMSKMPCVIVPVCIIEAKKALLWTTLINKPILEQKLMLYLFSILNQTLEAVLGTNQEKNEVL